MLSLCSPGLSGRAGGRRKGGRGLFSVLRGKINPFGVTTTEGIWQNGLVHLQGLEPWAPLIKSQGALPTELKVRLERVMGIEPT